MDWTAWLRNLARGRREAARPVPGPDEIRAALEQRGVPEGMSSALADRMAEQLAGQDGKALAPMLDGVALAFDFQQTTQEQLTRSLRGLREVERMMGAFSGELSKLDEVLGVLAAYVRRMKSSGTHAPNRVLH